ncbi:ribosome recycling factor [Candidatus Peribacteria bacterium]|nr:MAG: ribosome recycling factor [Candidatus Peribacteria bacterium]
MSDVRISTFEADSQKVIAFMQSEFAGLQTGRASAALVENIDVDAYDQRMNMKAVAGISVQDAKTIVIQPWDRTVLSAIEKAIQQSSLGLNPMNDGVVIRLTLPAMTEERREQLKKLVHKMAEEARISVRQARQKAQDSIKQEANETLKGSLTNELQKAVDKANERIDELRAAKEEEVMKV